MFSGGGAPWIRTELTMPFRDRIDAGRQLAAKLSAYANRGDIVVIGLPRGGVPVALEVARALRAPLDVLLVRRIATPADRDVTIGAVAPGGVRVLDDDLIHAIGLSERVVQREVERAETDIAVRERIYANYHRTPDLSGRTVIIVDDGIATGASMTAAVRVIESRRPAAIVIAVPVASIATCARLAPHVRETVYCYIRDPVYSVGLWYENYPPVSDDDARRFLERAANEGLAATS
jgi:predicted phosphoribosyltransferase